MGSAAHCNRPSPSEPVPCSGGGPAVGAADFFLGGYLRAPQERGRGLLSPAGTPVPLDTAAVIFPRTLGHAFPLLRPNGS